MFNELHKNQFLIILVKTLTLVHTRIPTKVSYKKQNVFLTYYFFLQLLSTFTLAHIRIPTKASHKKQNVFLTYFFFSFFQLLHWHIHVLLPRCHIKSKMFFLLIFSSVSFNSYTGTYTYSYQGVT